MTSLAAPQPRSPSARSSVRPAPHPAAPAANAAVPAWDGSGATFRLEERAWGFRVRPRAGRHPLLRLARGAALLAGVGATAAGLTLTWPALQGAGAAWDVRLAMGALLGGLLLLWLATRGTSAVFEVDRARGEVRRVVPHLLGRPTRLAAHRFDEAEGLRLAPARRGMATLLLDTAGGRPLAVATGTRAALAPLRRRIERDVMPAPKPPRRLSL